MDKREKLKVEGFAIDTLIEKGTTFSVPRKGPLKYIFGKTKQYVISQPYLGTLDYITREFLTMDVDVETLKNATLSDSNSIAAKNIKQMARIVSVAILNSKWKIKLFTGLLSRRLMWEIKPGTLYNLTIIIIAISNTADFTNSIRLMSGVRTTAPKADLVEQQPKV